MKAKKKNPGGFGVILVLGAVAAGGYYAYRYYTKKKKPSKPTPEQVCAHISSVFEKTIRTMGTELPAEALQQMKDQCARAAAEDPEMFDKAAPCIMKATTIVAIDECLDASGWKPDEKTEPKDKSENDSDSLRDRLSKTLDEAEQVERAKGTELEKLSKGPFGTPTAFMTHGDTTRASRLWGVKNEDPNSHRFIAFVAVGKQNADVSSTLPILVNGGTRDQAMQKAHQQIQGELDRLANKLK